MLGGITKEGCPALQNDQPFSSRFWFQLKDCIISCYDSVITSLTCQHYGSYRQAQSTSHYLHHPIEGNCYPKPSNQIFKHLLITSYSQDLNSLSLFYFLLDIRNLPECIMDISIISHIYKTQNIWIKSKFHHLNTVQVRFIN